MYVALPSILYGSSIVSLTDSEIRQLQKIENSVFRQILGAPKFAPNCTLRGEVGASEMKTRIMKGRLSYVKNVHTRENQLLKNIMEDMEKHEKSIWTKTNVRYRSEVDIKAADLHGVRYKDIQERTRKWDSKRWEEEVKSKSSLGLYRKWKTEIKEEAFYDNRPASVIMYRARTATLPLKDRQRHIGQSTECDLCGADLEDLKHFILECSDERISEKRCKSINLQKPFQEDSEVILGTFLFDLDHMEEKKDVLYEMWRARALQIKSKMAST